MRAAIDKQCVAGQIAGIIARQKQRDAADIGPLAASDSKWEFTAPREDRRVWTDDYSNVIGAVWRRLRDGE